MGAIAGLLAPALLALAGFHAFRWSGWNRPGCDPFAALIGYLAALTGGVVSPLVVWFALVPAEAALAGGRAQVVRAGFAAAAALLVVASIEALGALPASRPSHLAAMGDLCRARCWRRWCRRCWWRRRAQDRQRAADGGAAEGAAMYRFLADNAMDLITRHSSDGRIRFASPAAMALLGRRRTR